MKKHLLALAATTMACIAGNALAAPTTYQFETLTEIKLDRSNPSLTGVLRNTASPITVQFLDQTNSSYRYIVNRCVPLFVTMMEKPGKYWLNLVVDPAEPNINLMSCSLQVRD